MITIPNLLFDNITRGGSSVITGGSTKNQSPRRIILQNGLRVVYEKSPSILPLTSIQCFVHMGSINETKDVRGISHIIEHMVFKGTPKLPTSTDVAQPYDKSGAYMNAYTDKQVTCYVIKCQNEFVEVSLQVLSDMLFHSKLERAEYVKEYDVVIEEARINVDDIASTVDENITKMLYRGSSYENPVDHLSYHHPNRITHERAVEIYKNYYVPKNMVLSIVSPLPFNTIMRYIKNTYFWKERIHRTTARLPPPNLYLEPFREAQIVVEKKAGQESTNVAIGFRTCNMYSNEKYILNLLKFVLIGPIMSRFFRILRDENGLTYRTSISVNNYEHTGDFTVYTQVDPNKLLHSSKKPGLLPIIARIFADLRKSGVTPDEFKTAKGYLKGILTRHLEDNDSLADHNGKHLLFDNGEPDAGNENVFSYMKKYELCYSKITREDIHRVIQKYFIDENLCIFILGSKVPSVKTVRDVFRLS